MSGEAVIISKILIGSGGITPELEAEGYFATICSQVRTGDGRIAFQDLHVTPTQLADLKEAIGQYLLLRDKLDE
ncbi:MAG: hypothetical protein ACRC62_34015 [Microcoleus sp.]